MTDAHTTMKTTTRGISALLLAGCAATAAPGTETSVDGTPAPAPPPASGDVGASKDEACAALAAPTVVTIAKLAVGRYAPSASLAKDGRVVVAGGFDFAKNDAQASSDVVDPTSGHVTPGPSLGFARNFAATVVTGDGSVLVFGGFHPRYGSLDDVETLAPGAARFVGTDATMNETREAHTATLLGDGRVLLAGGLEARGLRFRSSAEIYDAEARRFASAGVMTAARAFHGAARLDTGDVLVVGGDSGKGELASVERFDVASGRFVASNASLRAPAKAMALTRLADGRVLVAGGSNAKDGPLALADVYDPKTDAITPVASMATRRMAHSLTALADGRVLAVGGWSEDAAASPAKAAATDVLEVWDPAKDAWTTLPVRLARPRLDHVAVPLGRCRVLVVGGQTAAKDASPAAPLEVELVTLPPR